MDTCRVLNWFGGEADTEWPWLVPMATVFVAVAVIALLLYLARRLSITSASRYGTASGGDARDGVDSPASCKCQAVGRAVQTFRIRRLSRRLLFRRVLRIPGRLPGCIEARAVWKCRRCGQLFAHMRVIFDKDGEAVLVRAPDANWPAWNWDALASTAADCRWRGPTVDRTYVL